MRPAPEHPHHSPEQEVILACLRLDHAGDARIGELIRQGLDWPLLVQIAAYNKVIPLVYKRLKALGAGELPQAEFDLLRAGYQANALRNLRLAKKLARLVKTINGLGIDCLVFKGPALAVQGYGDLTLRQFTDLDLLVHKRNLPAVCQAMVELGCIPEVPIERIGPRRMVKAEKHFAFHDQGDIIEIHGEILDSARAYPLRPEWFWQDSCTFSLLGMEATGFSMRRNLVMACMQGTGDQWELLKSITDVAWLCQFAQDFDWLEFLHDSRQMGIARVVSLGLLLAHRVCGTAFPPEVLAAIHADPTVQSLVEEVFGRLAPAAMQEAGSSAVFYLRARERLRDRLYYAFDQAFIPKQVDWYALPLPDTLAPLYYLIRPVRLAVKLSKKVFADGLHRKI